MFSKVITWIQARRKAQREAVMLERQVRVSMDFSGISAAYPDGKTQTIPWADIRCVAIETNDSGPWGADVWWLFEGADRRCAYPQGATGEDEVFKALSQRFSGFDFEQVTKAMVSTSNARFVCWNKTHAL